jgi:hypothetical protein
MSGIGLEGSAMKTITLFRPVGSKELKLIQEVDFSGFPSRLPSQPIFYPVTNEAYAIQIARDWNVKHNEDHKGFVTSFDVDAEYLARHQKRIVGGASHEEYWIPAEELSVFNAHIVGKITVTHEFSQQG